MKLILKTLEQYRQQLVKDNRLDPDEAFAFIKASLPRIQKSENSSFRQRLLTFLPAFEIEIGGRVRGEIRKQFSFFKPRYEIDYNGWRVEGDFLGWDYDVYNGCSSIIHISKELFHWGDTYTINFVDPKDELED